MQQNNTIMKQTIRSGSTSPNLNLTSSGSNFWPKMKAAMIQIIRISWDVAKKICVILIFAVPSIHIISALLMHLSIALLIIFIDKLEEKKNFFLAYTLFLISFFSLVLLSLINIESIIYMFREFYAIFIVGAVKGQSFSLWILALVIFSRPKKKDLISAHESHIIMLICNDYSKYVPFMQKAELFIKIVQAIMINTIKLYPIFYDLDLVEIIISILNIPTEDNGCDITSLFLFNFSDNNYENIELNNNTADLRDNESLSSTSSENESQNDSTTNRDDSTINTEDSGRDPNHRNRRLRNPFEPSRDTLARLNLLVHQDCGYLCSGCDCCVHNGIVNCMCYGCNINNITWNDDMEKYCCYNRYTRFCEFKCGICGCVYCWTCMQDVARFSIGWSLRNELLASEGGWDLYIDYLEKCRINVQQDTSFDFKNIILEKLNNIMSYIFSRLSSILDERPSQNPVWNRWEDIGPENEWENLDSNERARRRIASNQLEAERAWQMTLPGFLSFRDVFPEQNIATIPRIIVFPAEYVGHPAAERTIPVNSWVESIYASSMRVRESILEAWEASQIREQDYTPEQVIHRWYLENLEINQMMNILLDGTEDSSESYVSVERRLQNIPLFTDIDTYMYDLFLDVLRDQGRLLDVPLYGNVNGVLVSLGLLNQNLNLNQEDSDSNDSNISDQSVQSNLATGEPSLQEMPLVEELYNEMLDQPGPSSLPVRARRLLEMPMYEEEEEEKIFPPYDPNAKRLLELDDGEWGTDEHDPFEGMYNEDEPGENKGIAIMKDRMESLFNGMKETVDTIDRIQRLPNIESVISEVLQSIYGPEDNSESENSPPKKSYKGKEREF